MRKITTHVKPGKIFSCSNPNNFVVIWNNYTFGCAEGRPFTNMSFSDFVKDTKKVEIDWLTMELLFIDSLREKLSYYKSILERKSK